MTSTSKVTVEIGDMTGQRNLLSEIPAEASWGEALSAILSQMSLPPNDTGTNEVWTGRLEREGRHIHASEIVGDALQEGDRVVLQRDIQAG